MQRQLVHLPLHHLLLLLLFIICLMCEVVGSDSGVLGVTSAPLRDGRARAEVKAKARRKRSWTVPGTLWCGMSSKAATYEDLGMFEDTDRCCRDHDHCVHAIPSFTVNYGVFNSHFYTLSHCDCDQRFRQCLLGVDDTVSSVVGYSFFSLLRVPCFELTRRTRCTRLHWWGTCKLSKEAPYAVLKTPLPYDNSNATSKSPKNKHRCRSRDPPRGDTFYRRATGGKGCKKASSRKPQTRLFNATESGALTSKNNKSGGKGQVPPTRSVPSSTPRPELHPRPPTTGRTTTSDRRKGGAFWTACENCLSQELTRPETTTRKPSVGIGTLWTTRIETRQERRKKTLWNSDAFAKTRPKTAATLREGGKPRQQMRRRTTAQSDHVEKGLKQNNDAIPDYQLLCGSLKHLDDCRFLIPPLETKYGLRNQETKTVYHCDCTTRLAASLRRFERASVVVPALLTDFVSRRCFETPEETKCQRGKKRCSGGFGGGFGEASDLLRAMKKMEERKEQRLGGDARKRAIPVRLYKRCVKLEREAETTATQTT